MYGIATNFMQITKKNGQKFGRWGKSRTFALANAKQHCALNGALVQLVRIHACHAWGHGFESRTHRFDLCKL